MTRPTLADLRASAPSLAVTGTTVAGLVLVAPLEHALGLALGLSWWHAWAVTALVEGAAGAAVIAGHHVRAALTLTGGSVLIGTLWSAAEQVRADHARDPLLHPATSLADDPARAGAALGLTVLAVAGLALVHRVRARIDTARDATATAAARAVAEQARLDREHAVRMARLDDERETRRLAAEERQHDAARRHEAELARQRAWAEQETARQAAETTRLALEVERAREEAARQAAEAERQRAETARQHAEAEERRAETRRQEQAEARQRAEDARRREEVARQADAARRQREDTEHRQRMAADREYARLQWLEHRWPATELAALIGRTDRTARTWIAEWTGDLEPGQATVRELRPHAGAE